MNIFYCEISVITHRGKPKTNRGSPAPGRRHATLYTNEQPDTLPLCSVVVDIWCGQWCIGLFGLQLAVQAIDFEQSQEAFEFDFSAVGKLTMATLGLSALQHLGATVVLGYCDISAAGIREYARSATPLGLSGSIYEPCD